MPVLAIGSHLRNNDPRENGYVMRVRELTAEHAILQHLHSALMRPARIAIARIHLDGKPRRSGWSLVMTAADLDGEMVKVIDPNHEMSGFCGEAQDRHEHGWIDIHLDAVDETDTRIIQAVGPDQVEIINRA